MRRGYGGSDAAEPKVLQFGSLLVLGWPGLVWLSWFGLGWLALEGTGQVMDGGWDREGWVGCGREPQ